MKYKIFKSTCKPLLFLICIAAAVLVGIARLSTGPEYALSLFYLFPIIITSWYVGKWAGLILCGICDASWLVADLYMIDQFSSSFVPFINETFRLIVFVVIGLLIAELKKALENQKNLARIDPLTRVANRRAFFEIADLELKRARRFCHPISVIYIDLDNFKSVNDRMGHDTGDQLLCEVAACIKENLRGTDILARFGGDEFCVMLAETSGSGAYRVASKMNKILLQLMARRGWPVTFSIGVATFETLPDAMEEIVQLADKLMYKAKKKKKDKIFQEIVSEPKFSESL
jgi:diguanylate cyclase (GGDEF)-like protein